MDHLIDDSDRLKRCPFCGAEAEIITLEGETDDPSIGAQCVQCTSSACGAASGLIYPLMDDVTDLLRERWNKRQNEASPEFTDTARAALLWVLWHHQGGSSPVGQPIRYALGMGAHEPLSEHQVQEARRWAALTNAETRDFHGR